MCASVAAHGVFLLVLLHRPAPIFVAPSSVAYGTGEKSYHIVYVAPDGDDASERPDNQGVSLKPSVRKKHAKIAREKKRPEPVEPKDDAQEGEASDHFAHAGTRYGTLASGPAAGHDVRPALPVVFPDPPVSSSELPAGFQGDVIVEITIDEHGTVVDMKVLQSASRGIDEKVLATLQTWRYTPATMDGVPIVSRHDVHFHFPG